ncbi:hypothetical protein ACROYT_G021072 [Oculina patagonica]
MPNLSGFERNLYRDLNRGLSVYRDQPSRTIGLHIADKTFAKTRFTSHIGFLSKCLRRNVIPNGFLFSFHAMKHEQNHSTGYRNQVNAVLRRSSSRLMLVAIQSMQRRCQTLTTEINRFRDELKNECSVEEYRQISSIIHNLNSDLYNFLKAGKSEKLNALINSTSLSSENDIDSVPEATTSKLVVTIPDDLQLTDPERSVLSKGLSYIPVKPWTDEYDTKADCERFYRRLRLTAHFDANPSEPSSVDSQPASVDESEDKSFESLKHKPSNWTPPPGRLNKTNLTKEEIAALASLRRRDDIVIKLADKGGAVVVWARQLYVQEAERHLSDANFYRQLSHDHTNEYNERVQVVVKEAIQSRELPASASNLIVDQPRTSKFYLLPKIHKPGNPGRPIVSACNCPTELIVTYLDQITTPSVHNLPSFVKDTNHMLQIAESFRFPELTNYVFTMDVKSLYTVIPNRDGLLALEHFLNKRSVLQPPTHTLLRLAELVLTLNTFAFNGNYYEQVGGVAMGSRLGPNYACLFMGHIEEQIFEQYPGRTPDLFKRYIDDIMGAASCSKREIEDFCIICEQFPSEFEIHVVHFRRSGVVLRPLYQTFRASADNNHPLQGN